MRLVLERTRKVEGSVRTLFSVLIVAAVLASLLCVGSLPVPARAADWPGAADLKLTASDGVVASQFGCSVAISGDTAVVGASGHTVGANYRQGAAYIFVRSGTDWSQQTRLIASDGAAYYDFGFSVAIDGDTVVVGAPSQTVGGNSQQGSAYVFVRSGTDWTQQAELTAGDGAASDWFGSQVAIDGDTVVVGAYQDDVGANSGQGSAYVFVRSGTTWSQQAQLVASDGAASDYFGHSVAISGDTVVVGVDQDDVGAISNQGSAYVFVRSGTTWSQQTQLVASDGAASDYFGISVAIDGDTVVAGSQWQGAAYVFTRSGTFWTQRTRLTASDYAAGDVFGNSVDISGNTVVVGAYLDDVGANEDQGSAYVFVGSGTDWSQERQLVAGDGATVDYFGRSVAVDGDTALVGAYADDVGDNTDQGSAYVYDAALPEVVEGDQIAATVTLEVISVTISEGFPTAVGYGKMGLGVEAAPNSYSPSTYSYLRAENSGSVVENLLIRGADATCTGGTWSLAATPGADQYSHLWGLDKAPTTYYALKTTASTLGKNVAVKGVVDFNLKIQTPTSSTVWGQYSTTVQLLAVAAS